MNEKWENFLRKIKCQFLCGYPLSCMNWEEFGFYVSWEQQEELMKNTILHPFNQSHPVKVDYQLNFLKKIIKIFQGKCEEIHDLIYCNYTELLNTPKMKVELEKYAFKHYLIEELNLKLTLKESNSFVASGTTGLCSWQASLALTDFLLHNETWTKGKHILELGAGTGLCGFMLLKSSEAKEILLTDGSIECINLMKENLKNNFPNVQENNDESFLLENKKLKCFQLFWNDIESSQGVIETDPDLLLAADVTYDESIFQDLVEAIDFSFKRKKDKVTMFLAATLRNENTLQKFLQVLESKSFKYEEKNVIPEHQSYLHWDRSTPVKIFQISR